MSNRQVYSLSTGMKDRLNNSKKFSGSTKMDKGCEVGRVRICEPVKKCYDKVTTQHVEDAPCDDGASHGHHEHHEHHGYGYSSLGWAVLWFIIIAVIVWLIIFSLKPAWALNEDGDVDTGKVLLASIVIALIIIIIIWLIYAACTGGWY